MKLIDIDEIDFSSFRQTVTMRDVEEYRRRQEAKIPIIAWCVIVAAVVIVLIVATVISMVLTADVTFKIGPFMFLTILGIYAYLILSYLMARYQAAR